MNLVGTRSLINRVTMNFLSPDLSMVHNPEASREMSKMSAQSMLEQLLKSGLSMLEHKPAGTGPAVASHPEQGLGQFGTGAVAGGALGLLLGSKGGRRIGGKALQYGGVAALGLMAFRAFSNWQAQQPQPAGSGADVSKAPALRTVNMLSSFEVEEHSRGISGTGRRNVPGKPVDSRRDKLYGARVSG